MSLPLLVLQLCVLVAFFASVSLLVFALLSAPSMPPERLGLRGFKRMQGLRNQMWFAHVEPMMRWLSMRLGGLLSPELREKLNLQITRAGDMLGLSAEDVISLSVMSAFLCGAWGVSYGYLTKSGYLVAVVAFCFGAAMPYLQIHNSAANRVRSIQRALPSVIDLMVLGLGAGLDFAAAVRQVIDHAGRADEPLIEELRLLLQELQLGRTRKQALQQLAHRAPGEAVRELVQAVIQSEEQGTPLAAVLAAQAAGSRNRRSVQAEETAAKVTTRLMLPLGLLFLSVMLLIISPMILKVRQEF
ncbi:MAG TPA: type II secretion system F family protein [Polyangiales bacterium]|nr:type II secretion system F family protein [Polyangiales bacterium]